MSNKKFDKELYDKYNEETIDASVRFLENFGYKPINREESYKSHDIIFEKDGVPIKVEVERSLIWRKTNEWQGYPEVSCPYRKKDSQSKLYLQFNANMSAVAVSLMETVHKSRVVFRDTRYKKNEPFFHTPTEHYDFFFNNLPEKENRYL